MFVLVQQESFATVSVGIFQVPCFVTGIHSEGVKKIWSVCLHEGDVFRVHFFSHVLFYFPYCECFLSREISLSVGSVASAVLLKLANLYFWLTLRATSWGLLSVFRPRGPQRARPLETCGLCPLGLRNSGARTCERKFITKVKGCRQAGMVFPQLYTRSLHEHMTNNHSDTEERDGVICHNILWGVFFTFIFSFRLLV